MALSAYFKILRPLNCIISAVAVFIGFSVANLAVQFTMPLLMAMIAAFLICGAGQAINDYYDAKIDKKIRPEKPIPSGKISAKGAFAFSIILFILGIALSYFINIYAFVIALTISLLLFCYSAFLGKYKYIGNWIVASGTALTLVFGASVVLNFRIASILALSALFANVARELTKDFEDLDADLGFKTSLPQLLQGMKVKLLILTMYLAAIIVAFAPFALGLFRNLFYPALVAVSGIIFIFAALLAFKNKFHKAQNFSKLGMIIALVAFFIGIF